MPHVGDKLGCRWKDIVESCPKTCRSLLESNAHVPEQPSFEIGPRGAGCYLASCTVHTSAATESFRLQPLSTRSTPARHFALLSLKYLLCFILRQPKPRPRPHRHGHSHNNEVGSPTASTIKANTKGKGGGGQARQTTHAFFRGIAQAGRGGRSPRKVHETQDLSSCGRQQERRESSETEKRAPNESVHGKREVTANTPDIKFHPCHARSRFTQVSAYFMRRGNHARAQNLQHGHRRTWRPLVSIPHEGPLRSPGVSPR